MSDTYSSKPFITHDGVDGTGVRAEVRVVVGYGEVLKIEPSDAGKSGNVKFQVANTKYNPSGWAPLDSNVMKKIEEAKASGEPIHFRIETRRKDSVDRSRPMQEIAPPGDMNAAKENVVKSLAAVKLTDESEWTLSPHARTRLDEDPNTGGVYSANDQTPEQLGRASSQPGSAPQASPQHNGFEPAPFVTRLRSGELNPGSMAVAVPLNLYSFIVEYEREQKTGELTLTDRQRITVAKLLLAAANELQLAIYEGYSSELEKPDLSSGSHTRARALLFEGVRTFYPLTDEIVADKEKLLEWKTNLVAKALGMWRWSLKEVSALLS